MTLNELKDLLREGKTIDEILALRGETAKELLYNNIDTIIIPIFPLEMALSEVSQAQAMSILRTIREFWLGNYDYIPVEKIPNYLRRSLRQSIQAHNYSYLFCHILENLSEE